MCVKEKPQQGTAGTASKDPGFYAGARAGENQITEHGQELLKQLYEREAYLRDQLNRVHEASQHIRSEEGRRELRIFETCSKAQNKVTD